MFRLSHSIARRLTSRVTATILIIFSVIALLIAGFIWMAGTTIGFLLYMQDLDTANDNANNTLQNIETAVANTAPEVEEFTDRPEKMYDITERILRINPNIIGSAVAFRPGFYPQKGTQFAPYAYRQDSLIKTKQLGTATYNYHQMEWYTKAVAEGEGYWSDPYVDEGGGGIPMITYSLPLKDTKGETYAVLTADIALNWITTLITEEDDGNSYRDNTYSFIVSRNGTFIAHPDTSLIMKETILEYTKKTPGAEDDSIAVNMLSGKMSSKLTIDTSNDCFIYYAPIERAGWSMAIVVPTSRFAFIGTVLGVIVLVIMGLGLIIVSIVCYLNIRSITKPISRFAQAADQVAQGKFNAILPHVKSKDEMLQLHTSFKTMQESLIRQIEETRLVNEQKGSIERELHIARNIQMSMLPKTFPPFPDRADIDIFAQLTPAKEVGGDLYDFYIRDGKLFFCIGDVNGKGVPATLVMTVTRALFRSESAHESDPARIVSHMNEVITDNNEAMLFVTFFIGVLDLPTGRLRYCNGGHNAPLTINGDEVHFLNVTPNLPIGIDATWKYQAQETMMPNGASIFLYTDGLSEAENKQHTLYGDEQIAETLRYAPNCSPQELIALMNDDVTRHADGAEQSDDLTMLCVRYKELQQTIITRQELTLHNQVDEITRLAPFIETIGEEAGLDASLTMSLNLALEEAVTNVILYAYPKDADGLVHIEAITTEKQLQFVITDAGKPFDPTVKEDADITLSAEERPIGGLGIYLVRQLMDTINYERVNGHNVLTLYKNIEAKHEA